MRKRFNAITILLLILSINDVFGDGNKTKSIKVNHSTNSKTKNSDGIKRSTNLELKDKEPLNRGKRQIINKDSSKNYIDSEANRKFRNLDNKLNDELPFWGNRGRRSSEENYVHSPYADILSINNDLENLRAAEKFNAYQNFKDRREDMMPFWGNRGRRSSDEVPDDSEMTGPFWSSRGRRQDDDPFWGARGRRDDNLPFWGNRGRRDEEPFWGNRGRRDENEPFWGNRGRRDENEPFWGNRGRRQEDGPFWGNRGKKDDDPFWGARGKKEFDNSALFWGNKGRRKEDLKDSIIAAINKVEHDIDNLSRLKRGNGRIQNKQFWANRGRDSQLRYLFEKNRLKNQPFSAAFPYELSAKPSQSSTVNDDRIFADEPHYIIVERSSRSSAELDPFFISRGKKQSLRGRRGALEEIVKSVRNDPYYIARGKKDSNDNQAGNPTHEDLLKAKELICATLELTYMKNEGNKVKREINENDRDRRNILKKLAAQLQNDPYFVSRGKKSDVKEIDIEDFVNQVPAMCN